MHMKGILHKTFSTVMHKKRLDTLYFLINALLVNKKLSVTQLGRSINLPIQERSGIRRADRFLGNKKLQAEKICIQRALARQIIGSRKRAKIIVDWSDVPNTFNVILRAAYIAKGRALTIYEEVHPLTYLSNPSIEKKFLVRLKLTIPPECKAIIVTDAGFHNQWFKEVLKLGWDYIGRVRSAKKCSFDQGKNWYKYTDLFNKASSKPKCLGGVLLCKGNPIESNLYVYKGKTKNRSLLNKFGKKRKDTNSYNYRKSAKDPWVLASSLKGKEKSVIKIYKNRMQIEESFRDLKSSRVGFGLENSYTKTISRLEILLLIAAIAAFFAWIIGYWAESKKLHYQFQSNSIKNKRVLSFFYLGCQIVKRRYIIPFEEIFPVSENGLSQAG